MTDKEFIERISFIGEEWRDVIGYEGQYMVSSFGRVASKYRSIQYKDGRIYTYQPVLKKQTLDQHGYLFILLHKNGKRKRVYSYRLVAESFISNPSNLLCIDHIDTNKINNHASNLKWCTQKENMNNPLTIERNKKTAFLQGKFNENHPRSKKVVRISIDGDIKIYPSTAETQRDGFRRTSVSHCCHNNKTHRGYRWLFLPDYENLINKSKNFLSNS